MVENPDMPSQMSNDTAGLPTSSQDVDPNSTSASSSRPAPTPPQAPKPYAFTTLLKRAHSFLANVLAPKVIPPLINGFKRIGAAAQSWLTRFKDATPRQQAIMAGKPLLAAVALWAVTTYGPLFLPPSISTSYPDRDGSEAPLDSTIEIIFDRPVVTSSAERNFSIEPAVPGTISWEGNQKLIFTPDQPLARSQAYTAKIGGTVFSSFGIPMLRPQHISFTTLGHPKVVLMSPETEALEELPPITVVFDRPMVPLTTATSSAVAQSAFTITPPIKGEGRWLGTTAYQFRPAQRLQRATTYTVTVPKGIASQDGGELQEATTWQFSSSRPQVMRTIPEPGYQFGSPTASIAAFVTQPINPESAKEHFKVFDEAGKEVDGTVRITNAVMGFYPSQPLNREHQYKAVVTKDLQGTEGPNGTELEKTWNFKVAALPAVVNSTPKNGSTDVAENTTVSISFKTPMNSDSLREHLRISPSTGRDPDAFFSSYNGTNTLMINSSFARSTTYTITLTAGATDQFGVPLTSDYSFSFATAAYKPSISIFPSGTYFGAFNQQVTPRLVAKVVNADKVDYSLFKLKTEDFLDLYQRRYNYKCGGDKNCSNWQSFDTSKLEKLRDWSETYEQNFNVPVHVVTKVTDAQGNNLQPGLYFVDMRINSGAHDNMVMIVSKTVLTVKKSNDQLFVWAVDQSTGQVVPDMQITLRHSSGNTIAEGKTNQDGVFQKTVDLKNQEKLFVFGQKDEELTVVSDTWNEGINQYDFGLPYHYDPNATQVNSAEAHKLFVTLDRPIYRPGHTVHFKGLVRIDHDGAYQTPPQGEHVSVSIKDTQNRDVYSENIESTSYGSVSGEFALSDAAQLGMYTITLSYKGTSFSQQFQVEAYRKPDLNVTITPNKNAYMTGETAAIDVQAAYYFGAPATDLPVTWVVKAQDSSFRWSKDWRYEFGDPDSYWSQPWWQMGNSSYFAGKIITEGKGTTDSDGAVRIQLPLSANQSDGPQRYQVEAVVNDQNNQSIAGSYEINVHQGSLYAGLRPARYRSAAGTQTAVELVSLSHKQEEVPNRPVTVEFYKRSWQTVREQNPDDGQFYNVSKPSDTLITSTTTTTDELARAKASFTPSEGGVYRVVATIADDQGRQNRSSTYLWVSGANFATAQENNDRMVVVTDKRDYKVGESASVFVASPYASESAKTLLTMERGNVIDYKVVDTSETSSNFEFPITDRYAPNLFVSALLIRPGSQVKKPAEFKMGYSEIMVTDPHKQVVVTIKPDKQRYLPQEKLRATIETKDATGNPVSTELAVSLVDKAVWDLSQVSPAEIYQTFYQPRRLGVETAQLLTHSIDRINANTNLGAKGGSGGGGGGEGFDTTRTQFPDTAFWQAHVQTDAQGVAHVEIDLPDSLTTWRMAAVASSSEAAFGSSVGEVVVSKDVLIRPFMPRFLSVGDEARLGGIVVNTSGKTITVDASLKASGIEITSSESQTTTLADGEQTKFTWPTRALDATQAVITMSARDENGTVLDAVETTLPIKKYAIPEVTATAGQAKDSATETIELPTELDATQGELKVSLSPALGAGAIDGLSYLYNYPFRCTEQTSSRFIPAIYVSEIFTRFKIEEASGYNQATLKQVITDGIQRLASQQHSDGGWGWWVDDLSNPYLSAYAYEALFTADKEGYTVDKQTLERARSYLTEYLAQNSKNAALDGTTFEARESLGARAMILYALKDSGINLTGYADALYENRFKLTIEQRGKLAIALKTMPSKQRLAQRTYSELLSIAKKTATTTHWEEGKNQRFYFSSNDTTTATMLEALITFDPRSRLIPEVVRHLMMTRRDGHWSTTRDTAAVIKSVSKHLLATNTGKIDGSYKIELGGKTVQEGTFKKDDLFKLQEYAIAVSELGAGSTNELRMSKSGSGELYYNLDLKYFLPYEEIEALDQGITVVRELVDRSGKVISNTSIDENTEVWVRLLIVAPADRHYVAIEDILPAGFEAVNESLKNVSTLSSKPLPASEGTKSSYYFNEMQYFDDRTAIFAQRLPAGVYELNYRVRATTPGRYHYPPAQAYQMYTPDVSGHSAGGWLDVRGE